MLRGRRPRLDEPAARPLRLAPAPPVDEEPGGARGARLLQAPLRRRRGLREGALAFRVFCALAGAVYLVNDLVDLERDRLHPVKRTRPLASGALPRQRRASRPRAAVRRRRSRRAWRSARPSCSARSAYPALGARLLVRSQARRDPRRARRSRSASCCGRWRAPSRSACSSAPGCSSARCCSRCSWPSPSAGTSS